MYGFNMLNWSELEAFHGQQQPKRRLMLFVTGVCASVYIPLTIVNWHDQLWLICSFNIAFMLLLAGAALMIHRSPKAVSWWYVAALLTSLVLSCTTPIYYLGVSSSFWSFPVIASVFFLLPASLALPVNLSIACLGSGLILLVEEPFIAGRWMAAQWATLLVLWVFSQRIRKLQYQLEDLSERDPLTGALNRRRLTANLQNCLLNWQRSGRNAMIAALDIDNFKAINDRYGHAAGDLALVSLVEIIRENCRAEDQVYRLGGDELLLVLRDYAPDSAEPVLERIRQQVEQDERLHTSVSIGAAPVHQDCTVDCWLQLADQALYKAKNAGRNQLVLVSGDF